MIKNKKKKKEQTNKTLKRKIVSNTMKVLLIAFILYGLFITHFSNSNTISLLAVSENADGIPQTGSLVELTLKTVPGSGQIYINMNTLEEIDTQISIVNSQKIACDLFELNCERYDFYYDFRGSALVLKGPSASSAVAVLTAKTLKRENIDKGTVITGSLNSGGIIGTVGGIEEKVKLAEREGFNKVIIPLFSNYEPSNETKIEVVKAMDIIDAYNHFGRKNYELREYPINNEEYQIQMRELAENLCSRAEYLREKILNVDDLNQTRYENFLRNGDRSYNSSILARENSNYYSAGSFCYNANINYRIIHEMQKNLTEEERGIEVREFEKKVNLRYVELNSELYRENIKTINDFYAYLIIVDRINEAQKHLDDAKRISRQNIFEEIASNITNQSESTQNVEKDIHYSYAVERLHTVELWENLIKNTGELIFFDSDTIKNACLRINRQINMKTELLNTYSANIFREEIEKQNQFKNPLSNQYQCIYGGLKLDSRINTILNSIGITNNQSEEYAERLLEFTQSRLSLNSKGHFPLIPYIYAEYAEDLLSQGDISSSMLYSNYALSYSDLNLYLQKEEQVHSILNQVIKESFQNVWFVGALITIAVFLN